MLSPGEETSRGRVDLLTRDERGDEGDEGDGGELEHGGCGLLLKRRERGVRLIKTRESFLGFLGVARRSLPVPRPRRVVLMRARPFRQRSTGSTSDSTACDRSGARKRDRVARCDGDCEDTRRSEPNRPISASESRGTSARASRRDRDASSRVGGRRLEEDGLLRRGCEREVEGREQKVWHEGNFFLFWPLKFVTFFFFFFSLFDFAGVKTKISRPAAQSRLGSSRAGPLFRTDSLFTRPATTVRVAPFVQFSTRI